MFVCSRQSTDEAVEAFEPRRNLWSRVRCRLRRKVLQRRFARYNETRPAGLEPFTQARTPYGAQVLRQLPQADLINLHWIRGFVDVPAFFEQVDTPVVWTLHDMNAFTGGCHYDKGCGKYEAQCGACPQLGSGQENDLSRKVWEQKKSVFDRVSPERLHIVTPSHWLARAANSSTLLQTFPISVIPYGLDTELFSPRNGQGLRSALNLPEAARIVLFVAQSTTNERKGFSQLAEALAALDGQESGQFYLVSVGSNKPDWDVDLPHLHLGKITSTPLLAAVYSMADVFVIPSLEDNLPNTVLESMACGTPIVGFDTGGISDMVRPGETGWLAPVGNVRALRDTIDQALSDHQQRNRMTRRCREIAVEEYALNVQARQYRSLYLSLLN